MNKETKYPYVLFHINGSLYCLNSQYLSKIRPMPDYEKIPKAPASIMGMFRQDDRIVTLMDLRTELGYRSMSSECMEFEEMIDARIISTGFRNLNGAFKRTNPSFWQRIHISVPLDAGITISTQTIRPWHSICAK